MLLAAVLSPSFAAPPVRDPTPSHLGSPTAVELAPGSGTFDVGLTSAWIPVAGGAHGAAAIGITDRLAVFGDAYVASDFEGLFAGSSTPAGVSLGARYTVFRTQGIAVAPWIAGATGDSDGSSGLGFGVLPEPLPFLYGSHVMAGVAVEGGGERVRFDATVPLATFELERDLGLERSLMWTAARTEAGVSFAVGEDRRHTVRAGVISALPCVSYRYQSQGSFFAEGMVAPLVVSGRIGVRF